MERPLMQLQLSSRRQCRGGRGGAGGRERGASHHGGLTQTCDASRSETKA